MILEHEPRKIAINPHKFDKLITALRTAVDNDGTLDKEATIYLMPLNWHSSFIILEIAVIMIDIERINIKEEFIC
jgi:hypothetical protein